MLSFIIALFLAAVVWFIISILRIMMAAKRQTRSFFNQFSQQDRQPRSRKEGWSRPSSGKSKKIDRNIGEYVDFEEITVYAKSAGASGDADGTRTAKKTQSVESQITDVEWEDI